MQGLSQYWSAAEVVDELATILRYVRTLKFEERPEYDYIRKLLKDIAQRNCFDFDAHFDWFSDQVALAKFAHVLSPAAADPKYSFASTCLDSSGRSRRLRGSRFL